MNCYGDKGCCCEKTLVTYLIYCPISLFLEDVRMINIKVTHVCMREIDEAFTVV